MLHLLYQEKRPIMNTKYLFFFLYLLCCVPAFATPDRQKQQSVKQITKPLPEEIPKFISEQYPGATILWFEKEEIGYEVGIQDADIKKKIQFGKEQVWLTTVWQIDPTDVPENLVYTLKDAAYDPSGIEKATVTETPEGLFYTLQLTHLNNELEITLDGLGKIIR